MKKVKEELPIEETKSVEESKVTKEVSESSVDNGENKVEEVSKVDEKKEPAVPKIQEHFEYEDEHLESIEKTRSEFLVYYKKHNTFKWAVGLIGLVVVAGSWIAIPNIAKNSDGTSPSWVTPALLVITVIVLCLIFAYTFMIKKTMKSKLKNYFNSYYKNMNEYLLDISGVSDIVNQQPDQIEKIQFDENKLFANVAEVGSRGLVEFSYKNNLMMMCDCAASVRTDKRVTPVFVGKYLIGPAKCNDDSPIFIYIKGDKRALPPTAIDGIKNVYDDKHMTIMTNSSRWTKVINQKITGILKRIKTGKQLIDVAITIYSGKIYFCLGYDDPVMVLPLQHGFDPSPSYEVKKELPQFLQIIEELNK